MTASETADLIFLLIAIFIVSTLEKVGRVISAPFLGIWWLVTGEWMQAEFDNRTKK